MSRPISICQIIKAAKKPVYRPALRTVVQANLKFGGFTLYPCSCDRKCIPPSEADLESLFGDIPELIPIFL